MKRELFNVAASVAVIVATMVVMYNMTSSVVRSPSGLRTNHPPPPYSASPPVVMGDAVGPATERPEEPGGRERRLANRDFVDEDLFGLAELADSYRRRPQQTGGGGEDPGARTRLWGNGSGPGWGGRG